MKTALRALAVGCALAGATTAHAQSQAQRPTLGFGVRTQIVSASTARLASRGLAISFALPRGRLRVEPEVGFAWSDRGWPAGGDGLITVDTTWTSRTFTVGSGVFYELARAESIGAYAGGRLTLDFAEQSRILGSGSGWATGGTLAAVLGGEYFLAPLVSLGLEAQAGFSVVSNKDTSDRPDSTSVATAGLALVRFYVP
jgi:hypothetical protein